MQSALAHIQFPKFDVGIHANDGSGIQLQLTRYVIYNSTQTAEQLAFS